MKASLKFVVLCFFSASLFSCQKEQSFEPPANKLIGTWKLVNIDINVESRVEATSMGETAGTVTKYRTATINNTGTISFDAAYSKAANIGYSIDAEVTVKTYGTGIDDDEFTAPFKFSLVPYNASAKYQVIGTDSLYFPEGTLFDMPAANPQPTPSAPRASGGKFSITGNTLLIISSAVMDTVINQSGVMARTTQTGSVIAKMERQ